MYEVKLPELGDGIETATVACWHVQENDPVQPEDDIVELVTDKASFQVQAGQAGIIKKIRVNEQQEATIGEVLAVIETP
ncbi:MAG: lipoyl domain-containing protein [Candidatus Omnitrophica bacterium]|nr:lipoyl domain-containing protein [Candidatus Omnitrophota bacterium]